MTQLEKKKPENYNLFLDDARTTEDVSHYCGSNIIWIYRKISWITVRSYDKFVEYVTANGVPKLISFDHDLADEHYDPDTWMNENHQYQEKTGYDCAKWLKQYIEDNVWETPVVLCHSMNPVGKKRILDLFKLKQ